MIYGDFPFLIDRKRQKKSFTRTFSLAIAILFAILFAFVVFCVRKTYRVEAVSLYAFCSYCGDETTAADEAAICVSKGGAGVTVRDGDVTCVIASVYTTRADAQAVAEKNGGSVVEISLPKLVTRDGKAADLVSRGYAFVAKYVSLLSATVSRYRQGTESDEAALALLAAYEQERNDFAAYAPPQHETEEDTTVAMSRLAARLAIWATTLR